MSNMSIPPTITMSTSQGVGNVSVVTAGGLIPGWVSGDPSGLAISGSVNTLFDLGPNWADYSTFVVGVHAANATTATGAMAIHNCDTSNPTFNIRTRAIDASQSGTTPAIISSLTPAINALNYTICHIRARYVMVVVTNADVALPFSADSYVTLTMKA